MGWLSSVLPSLPSLPFIPSPPTLSNPVPKPPKPAEVLMPPTPPKVLGGGAQKIYDIAVAPIKSTIAADPLLSWAQNGKFTPHNKRTRQGVHELYKQDRLAQRLGVREKDVVTVVEVAQVVVAIYFGASYLGFTSGAGTAAGGTGGSVSLATVNSAVSGVGTVAKLAKGQPKAQGGGMDVQLDAIEQNQEQQSDTGKKSAVLPVAIGGIALLISLLI